MANIDSGNNDIIWLLGGKAKWPSTKVTTTWFKAGIL